MANEINNKPITAYPSWWKYLFEKKDFPKQEPNETTERLKQMLNEIKEKENGNKKNILRNKKNISKH